MARGGVTYSDISKAAEAIRNNNQTPTVERVRNHLGTGSNGTIAPLLKRWKSGNNSDSDIAGLPNDLVVALKSLHANIEQKANERLMNPKKTPDTLRNNFARS